MRKANYLLIGLLVFGLAGCASLSYKTADGTEVSYFRFWTTADKIEGQVKDAKITVNNTKIDAASLQQLINLMGTGK
jgi:ABC-type glycerol-3-phosphate transport system substrate-binding protein